MIALLLLCKLSPTLHHTLISTFGSATEEHTSQNAKEFIAFIAPHWSFFSGAKNPIKPFEHKWPDDFHGSDGIWGIHPQVSIKGVVPAERFPDNSNVISLGPMTNVRTLLEEKNLREATVMGGVFNMKGNITPYAETNVAFDPDAAAYLFEHCQGIDVKVVPLDVTRKVSWTKEKVTQIPENADYKIWAKKLLLAWFENYGDKKQENFGLHDPLAAYSLFHPEVLEWKKVGVQVIVQGEKRGQTVLGKDNPPCQVALGIPHPNDVAEDIFRLIFA